MNNSSFIPQFNDPTINKIIRHIPPEELPKEQNSLIFDNKNGIVEIALWNNNTDEHPFHMHGHVFGVMFVGEKNEYPDEKKYNKKNPVISDNVTVPGFGYLVIRFIADNPDLLNILVVNRDGPYKYLTFMIDHLSLLESFESLKAILGGDPRAVSLLLHQCHVMLF
uniref:Plastocyanin-like domain-containing protein n=1 Tax=Rhizophagus irregularis (strain DAOM 181602 / DAOM 197198 / MUCL 43194) TaxID=747089 RepID=U9TE20_RHIID